MPTQSVSRYVTLNGLKLHYIEWGSEPATPIVCLHGLRAYGHWFDEFAVAVDDSYRVLALDQRGRGATDWAADGDYSRTAYVRDVAAFVDALRLHAFLLVGHSMGGLNAMQYTARHPARVQALSLLDIGPEIDPAGMRRIRAELGETPDDFASWADAEAFLRQRHPQASSENRETRRRWMLQQAADGRIVWRLDPAIFDPNLRADDGQQTWALLDQIRCPTLIVRGAVSDVLSVETCRKMSDRIPDSQSVEIPEAGHMVIEDNPRAFNAAMLEFLNRTRATAQKQHVGAAS